MRIETIATGDELLTGLTSDTNSRVFQQRLLDTCGLTVRRGVVIGDDKDAIIEALRDAGRRCDVVLVSGGLGPTIDDLTVDCACAVFNVDAVEHPVARAHLEARAAMLKIPLTPTNLRQARVPSGAAVELNQVGASPLIIMQRPPCTYFFVPGVPREYRYLVETFVVPRIVAMVSGGEYRMLRLLKTVAIPESRLADLVDPLAPHHPRITFGYRADFSEVHLKLLARAPTKDEAQAAITAAEAEVRPLLGDACYGVDDDTLASVVLARLRQRGEQLALAESITGGRIASLLTALPGASQSLWGSAVAYTDEAKAHLLAVPVDLLSRHTAVSESVAIAMAKGARAASHAAWGLSVTGFAGPTGGTDENPPGTVYMAIDNARGTVAKKFTFRGDRARIQAYTAAAALNELRKAMTS